MKTLYDGTQVSDETLTRMTGIGRVLLTPDEIEQREQEELQHINAMPRKKILQDISELESEITPRRIRGAILGTDSGWLDNKETEIQIERNKL